MVFCLPMVPFCKSMQTCVRAIVKCLPQGGDEREIKGAPGYSLLRCVRNLTNEVLNGIWL